jgi:glycosyltransferase involved in cell wall biosynthesis
MKAPRIYYYADKHVSHLRAATSYMEIIQRCSNLVEEGQDANIVILHLEPHDFESIYNQYPALKDKYVICYSVWETDELPESYMRSISFVQEVWTPSHYCCKSFRKYHDRVFYIPHVIERDTRFSEEDRQYIGKAIGYEKDCVYFLGVTRIGDPRKNVEGLVNAFLAVRDKMSRSRLVIKSFQTDPPEFINQTGIIYLGGRLSDERINALYSLSSVYVSAHHSEGWGLTLSDAMIFKKPVIATGFSGNMEFMSESNSFPVDYEEEYIRPEDCNNLFKPHMKWAYPDQADLEDKLVILYDQLNEEYVTEKVNLAYKDINRFSRDSIGCVIQKRLIELSRIL